MNFNKGNSVTFVVIKFESGKRDFFLEKPKRDVDGRDIPLSGIEGIDEHNLESVCFCPVKEKKLIEKCMKHAAQSFKNVRAYKKTVVLK